MNTIEKKTFLKNRMLEFQREISSLKKALADMENSCEDRVAELQLKFIEVLDSLENIENNSREKAADGLLDAQAVKMLKSIVSVKNRTARMLKACNVEKIEFPEGRAVREHSIIVDTQPSPAQENETILEVVKEGYLNRKSNRTIRKAELITVLNR